MHMHTYTAHHSNNMPTSTHGDNPVQHPELIVGAYGANSENVHEPEGVVLVWNMHLKERPEFTFHCQSAVTAVCMSRYHPNLVFGGTHSGQVVVWDNRSKATPVQRTSLSARGHTHPIFGMGVVGTQNAHSIVSASNDGRLCTWSLDVLTEPQSSVALQVDESKRTAVAVTCVAFPEHDSNVCAVGAEEAAWYHVSRDAQRAGVMSEFRGHHAPLTGIDIHSASGPMDFSDLVLTSSMDWSVKLWSHKGKQALKSFEDFGDYVYAAKWSPTHPSVFATVDGRPALSIFNINQDTEVAGATVMPESRAALNSLAWHSSGSSIAVGAADGRVYVYDLAEGLSSAGSGEWEGLQRTLDDLRALGGEDDSPTPDLPDAIR
eukprot:Colp12_sorted_trinity150504_noHs@2830